MQPIEIYFLKKIPVEPKDNTQIPLARENHPHGPPSNNRMEDQENPQRRL